MDSEIESALHDQLVVRVAKLEAELASSRTGLRAYREVTDTKLESLDAEVSSLDNIQGSPLEANLRGLAERTKALEDRTQKARGLERRLKALEATEKSHRTLVLEQANQ